MNTVVTTAIGALVPTAAGTNGSVNSISPQFSELRVDWHKISSLLGGTNAMRLAAERYLPKWPKEEDESYAARLLVSTLFPAFKRTVFTLSARPFSKPLTFNEDVPAQIKELCENADLQGNNLHVFAHETFRVSMGYGMCLMLTEHPERPADARTVAADRELGMRPYIVRIYPEQLLGTRVTTENGKKRLTMLRYAEQVEEEDGEFGTKCVDQVRVYDIPQDGGGFVRWRLYRQTENNSGWIVFKNGMLTLKNIPVSVVYGEKTGFMTAKPPLLELAHLNIKHWQCQSDQDKLMHVVRVPILTARCVGEKFGLTVGAASAVKLGDHPNAELSYTEHSGAAIGAGKTQLDDLCEEMRQSGAELLVLKPGPVTATEVASDNAVGMCALQEMAISMDDALNQSLQFMAEYLGLPSGGHVATFKDFAAATLAEASASLLIGLKNSGGLSGETLFDELKRRGLIAPHVQWEEEMARIEAEGPPEPPPGEPQPSKSGKPAPAGAKK